MMLPNPMKVPEWRANDFAIRSFRDVADGDYISARMAFRTRLLDQFLWASQQTIEKYLKCVLLLNRIEARKVRHNLELATSKIQDAGIKLSLTEISIAFIQYIDQFGRFRYLEKSHYSHGDELVKLDRTVWELRRFCTLDLSLRELKLHQGVPAPKICVEGGFLEKIIDDIQNPAREPLLWQNAFLESECEGQFVR